MSDRTIFNDFKKGIIGDMELLNKKIDHIDIKKVEVKKYIHSFGIIIYMSKNVSELDGAIANIIYKHKPVMSITDGRQMVNVISPLNKRSEIRFTRKLYVESEHDN